MDPNRFDTLTRSLTMAGTRRRALATVLGGAFVLLGLTEAEAKHKRHKRRKKKPCTPDCAGKTCGPDGCGGVCGRCNGSCANGTCLCPSGSKLCDGFCQQCCSNGDCEGGRACQQGTCGCPPGRTFCPNDGVCGECCDNTPCCGALVCGPGEPICLPPLNANRTCGCLDGRPPCNGVCCEAGFGCSNGVCAAISDRTMKANVAAIDPADMLERVRALPIATWSYTSDDPAIRHIGPMAQDFAALFGVGSDDRHIHPSDGQGVALAAIQGLIAELGELRAENTRLAARLERLERVPPA